MNLFIIIIVLSILFIVSTVWYSIIVPFYSNKIKLDILIIKKDIIQYCISNNISKANKKETLKIIDNIYFNIDDANILEFIFFVKIINRKKVKENSNKKILSYEDDYIKSQIEKVFIIVIKKMIFSSIVATVLFAFYFLFKSVKSNLNSIFKNILSKIDIMNLYKLFEKFNDIDTDFSSSNNLLNIK